MGIENIIATTPSDKIVEILVKMIASGETSIPTLKTLCELRINIYSYFKTLEHVYDKILKHIYVDDFVIKQMLSVTNEDQFYINVVDVVLSLKNNVNYVCKLYSKIGERSLENDLRYKYVVDVLNHVKNNIIHTMILVTKRSTGLDKSEYSVRFSYIEKKHLKAKFLAFEQLLATSEYYFRNRIISGDKKACEILIIKETRYCVSEVVALFESLKKYHNEYLKTEEDCIIVGRSRKAYEIED